MLFFPSFIVFLGIFRNTNSVTVCQNSVFAKIWDIKNEVFEKKIAFFVFLFYVGENEKKIEKTKKPDKNRVFLRWSSKNVKTWIFSKNCLTIFLCQEGRRKTRIFVHTICFGQNLFWTKTVQSRKHYKNRGFNGNCKKAKMTPFFGKGCLLTWLKKWVLLTVFLKSCVFLKTLFL